MSDLLDTGRGYLGLAGHLAGDVEFFLERSRNTTVKVYGGDVESIVAGEPSGVGVRYVHEGREGYAYTAASSTEAVRKAVEAAAANAEASDVDEAVGFVDPAADYEEMPGLWRSGLASATMEDRIAVAMEAEETALGMDGVETVEDSVYADSESEVAIVSTRGLEAATKQTFCYCYLSAHARDADDVQTGLGYDTGREPDELDPVRTGRMAGDRATALLGAAPCRTGSYTIVLDPEVTAAVLSVVVRALSAEAVQKGRSLFAGRLGQEVAAETFTLLDDGVHPAGMDSAPFDDEGVPRGTTPVIEGGVLRTFLYDSYTARREGGGARSTGNAHRGSYRGTPSVSSNNLVLEPGTGDLGDLLSRVDRGLYVVGVKGLHSGANPVSGEFSVGVVGHLFEKGALAVPVREVTIASDISSLLSGMVDRAKEREWVPLHGSALVPAVAVEGVTVSGS